MYYVYINAQSRMIRAALARGDFKAVRLHRRLRKHAIDCGMGRNVR